MRGSIDIMDGMNFVTATMMFVAALIAIVILIPVANEVLPFISASMGRSTALMVSGMVVVVIVVAMFVWVRQSSSNESPMMQGGSQGNF